MAEDKCAHLGDQPERFSNHVVIPSWVFFDTRISDKGKLLYGLLDCMSNHRGYCWARNETLERFLGGCSERTLQRHLKDLQTIGAIRVVEQQGGNGTVRKIFVMDGRPDFLAFYPDKNDGVTPSKMSPIINKYNNTPYSPPEGEGHGKDETEDEASEAFKVFWDVYGIKVKRKAALRTWRRLRVDDKPELFADIMEGLERAKASRQWVEGYAPHPSTWLNGERWKDEIPAPADKPEQKEPEARAEPKVEVWA